MALGPFEGPDLWIRGMSLASRASAAVFRRLFEQLDGVCPRPSLGRRQRSTPDSMSRCLNATAPTSKTTPCHDSEVRHTLRTAF